nr:SDR family NAD(P)-dependent oxidoreductase [Phyllobacterium sp. 2063]
MQTLRYSYNAVVVGSNGGIGGALFNALKIDARCNVVQGVDRITFPQFELANENSIVNVAEDLRARVECIDLLIVATGILSLSGSRPEKSLSALDGESMAQIFRVNAIGPALLLKHFSPLIRKQSKAVVAVLSARVGSISDNRLGGWISYRASKAALNQIVKTASIELARSRPESVCVALHPGTVDTRLSRPFTSHRIKLEPAAAATTLLNVIDHMTAAQTGTFLDYEGHSVGW